MDPGKSGCVLKNATAALSIQTALSVGGPMQVLRYNGPYTHRVAISNHRLMAFNGEQRQVLVEGLRARQRTAKNAVRHIGRAT
jgi:hypothetical protein